MGIKATELQTAAAPKVTDTLLVANSTGGTSQLSLAQAAAFFGAELVKAGNPVGAALSSKAALTDFAPVRDKVLSTTLGPAKSITMPVTELQAFLDAQSKLLTENLTITVNGTLNQKLGIPHFYGSCTLHIQAAERGGCVFQKGVTVRGEKVRFTNCSFSNTEAETHLDYECEAYQHVMLNLHACDFTGNSKGSAIVVHDFGKVIATSCTIKHYNRAVTVTYGGMAVIGCDKAEDTQNNSDGAYLWKGGTVIINPGTDPLLGGATHSKQGGLIVLPDGTLA